MRKAQMSLFIVLGIILILGILFFSYLLRGQYNASTELTVIESLDDARMAVESCTDEKIKEDLYAMGIHGGTFDEAEWSIYNTSYALPSIGVIEQNLEEKIGKDIQSCTEILEGTAYAVHKNSRPTVTVSLGSSIEISVTSLGSVYKASTENEQIGERTLQLDIDFLDMDANMQNFLENEYWEYKEYPDYSIEIFTNEEHSEQLIRITETYTGFQFQATKSL